MCDHEDHRRSTDTGADNTDSAPAVCDDGDEPSAGLVARLGIGLIVLYQRLISPMLPASCRYRPTCSQYAITAMRRHGLLRGGWIALRRILRCHPFHPGGYDPVP